MIQDIALVAFSAGHENIADLILCLVAVPLFCEQSDGREGVEDDPERPFVQAEALGELPRRQGPFRERIEYSVLVGR